MSFIIDNEGKKSAVITFLTLPAIVITLSLQVILFYVDFFVPQSALGKKVTVFILCLREARISHAKKNILELHNSKTNGSSTMAVSNSFLSPLEKSHSGRFKII